MAQYRILYWREIPSMVEAFDEGERVQVPLSARFQELIDVVAMRESASDSASYLAGWHQGAVENRAGSAKAVAAEVAAELEASYQVVRDKHLSISS